MALLQGSTIQWNDIANLLSEINIVRNKLALNNSSISGGGIGNTAKASTINDLWNALFACNGVNYPVFSFNGITSFETVFVNQIPLPNKGELIKLQPIFAIQDELNKIKALNTSGFCTSNFGVCNFNPNTSCFGFYFDSNTSCFGFCSFDASDFSFSCPFNPNTSDFSNFVPNSCFGFNPNTSNRGNYVPNTCFGFNPNTSNFSHRGSGFNSSNRGTHRGSGFNSSNRGTHRGSGFNSSHRSSDFSHRGSHRSFSFTFNSSHRNFSFTFNSSHRGSGFAANAHKSSSFDSSFRANNFSRFDAFDFSIANTVCFVKS